MTQVSFDEEHQYAPPAAVKQSWLVRMAFKTGLAKTEKEAQYVLLGVAALAVVVAVAFFLWGMPSSAPVPLPPTPYAP